MSDDNLLPFCFPAVRRKKITAAFDGGRITSDGGVILLAQAERRLGIAERLARVIPDGPDATRSNEAAAPTPARPRHAYRRHYYNTHHTYRGGKGSGGLSRALPNPQP